MALIEIMTFRLQPDTNRDDFIAADATVQSHFSYQQPGMMRRTMASAADGTWLIHTMWDSDDAAAAATDASTSSAVYADFLALIDAATIEFRAYTPAGAA